MLVSVLKKNLALGYFSWHFCNIATVAYNKTHFQIFNFTIVIFYVLISICKDSFFDTSKHFYPAYNERIACKKWSIAVLLFNEELLLTLTLVLLLLLSLFKWSLT